MLNKTNIIQLGRNKCQDVDVYMPPFTLRVTTDNGQTYNTVDFGLKQIQSSVANLMVVNNINELLYSLGLYTIVQVLRDGFTDNIYDLVPKTKIMLARDKELLKHMIKIYKYLGISYRGMHSDPHSMASYLFTTKIAPDIGVYYSRLSNTIYDRYSWEFLVDKLWKGAIPSRL